MFLDHFGAGFNWRSHCDYLDSGSWHAMDDDLLYRTSDFAHMFPVGDKRFVTFGSKRPVIQDIWVETASKLSTGNIMNLVFFE